MMCIAHASAYNKKTSYGSKMKLATRPDKADTDQNLDQRVLQP